MTAQFTDTFIFRGDQYSLIGISGGALALPEQFGMEPEQFSSACYRGFYATYELTEEALYFRELTLREKNGNYLPIAGILPGKEGDKATRSLNSEVLGFTVFPSSRAAHIATYHDGSLHREDKACQGLHTGTLHPHGLPESDGFQNCPGHNPERWTSS